MASPIRRPALGRLRWSQGEGGSAVVEFVLVAPILIGLALAVVQVSLALQVRATLVSAAAQGARAAALAGADPGAGVRRVRAVLADSLSASVVRRVTSRPGVVDGLAVIEVHIEADLPLVGLVGPSVLAVSGHALREDGP